MITYNITLDRGTSERAGAGGMFQVAGIWDEDGNDVTDSLIDVGMHYSSLEQVRRAIAKIKNVDTVDIELIDETESEEE